MSQSPRAPAGTSDEMSVDPTYMQLTLEQQGLWRNGSASDSRSEGWEFESLWPHFDCVVVNTNPNHHRRVITFRACALHQMVFCIRTPPIGTPRSQKHGSKTESHDAVVHRCRQGGGIEPLHVSMPRELKSSPSSEHQPDSPRPREQVFFVRAVRTSAS